MGEKGGRDTRNYEGDGDPAKQQLTTTTTTTIRQKGG